MLLIQSGIATASSVLAIGQGKGAHEPTWVNQPFVSRDDLPLLFARVEHRAWIVAIEKRPKDDRETLPPLDHCQCRFGLWLEGDGRARHGAQPAFAAIDALHRQVHALVAELLELQARGRNSEARCRIGELYGQRDALLEQLKMLAQNNLR